MAKKKNQNDKIKDLIDKLEVGIKDVFASDKYKAYLSAMSKFHSYIEEIDRAILKNTNNIDISQTVADCEMKIPSIVDIHYHRR